MHSFCKALFFPLWTANFVNCKRSSPNLVIIMLKPKPFRFYLKTFPSFTGRWTISHRAVNDQSLGGERSVTGRWTISHWAVNDGKMEIWGRQDGDSWTARRTSVDSTYEVNKALLWIRRSLGIVTFCRANNLVRISPILTDKERMAHIRKYHKERQAYGPLSLYACLSRPVERALFAW